MKGNFNCVYCGEKVYYDVKRNELVCSNPKCPEGDPSYGLNPLDGCIWVKISEHEWKNVRKEYILAHIHDFLPNRLQKAAQKWLAEREVRKTE